MDKFHSFTKGQFVKWKPGLKNRKFPKAIIALTVDLVKLGRIEGAIR